MKIMPGSRWKSAVCNTEVVVVRAPKAEGALECGGAPMLPVGAERPAGGAPAEGMNSGTLLGKRYANDALAIEVLCTKAGQGSLSLSGEALAFRESKPLPSSD